MKIEIITKLTKCPGNLNGHETVNVYVSETTLTTEQIATLEATMIAAYQSWHFDGPEITLAALRQTRMSLAKP